MSYPLNYPTLQNANVQILYKTGTWVKPQGASFVWMTLIGAGGGGGTCDSTDVYYGSGGGGAAVSNFMGPAFLIPDELLVSVGSGGNGSIGYGSPGGYVAATAGGNTTVVYQQKDATGYTLLTANGGAAGKRGGSSSDATASSGGAATAANFFTAMGFYQSIAGQDSTTSSSNQTASATTFLSGGSAGTASTANYGYSTTASGTALGAGYFQFQPIIVGVSSTREGEIAGIGCGGAASNSIFNGGNGGDGVVVIITW